MLSDRTTRSWGFSAAGLVGAGALYLGPILVLAHPGALGLADPLRLLTKVLAASLAMAWAVMFATLAYRAQDEFTREASKFAWYWGGVIGAGVSAPIFVFIGLGGLHLIGGGPPMADRHAAAVGFVSGYGLMAVSLLAGFAIARLWWSVSKR